MAANVSQAAVATAAATWEQDPASVGTARSPANWYARRCAASTGVAAAGAVEKFLRKRQEKGKQSSQSVGIQLGMIFPITVLQVKDFSYG